MMALSQFLWLLYSFATTVNCFETFMKQSHLQLMTFNQGAEYFLYIQNVSIIPKYGDCWTGAVENIQGTCNSLTEESQADLALQFTHCFMAMTTGETINIDKCNLSDKECINALPERTFQVFTTFYAHTQNICFYLMSQSWHEETERTIDLLRTHSKSVGKKLEFAGRLQTNMLEQQRESLKLQRHLIEHGTNLSELLADSHKSLYILTTEFRNSTLEHTRLLGELFGRLRLLHNWFVGEYAFVSQFLYYAACGTAILIATSFQRTGRVRLILIGVMIVNAIVEHIFSNAYLSFRTSNSDGQVDLFLYIWWLRKIFIAIMMAIYGWSAITYVDNSLLMLENLRQLRKQNEFMIKIITKLSDAYNEQFVEENCRLSTRSPSNNYRRTPKRNVNIVADNEMKTISYEDDVISDGNRYPRRLRKKPKL